MPKGWKWSGSPDRTIIATFVWAKKQRQYILSWKKSLEYVKKENRQNLRQRSSAYVTVWLPLLETLRTFKGEIAFENIRLIS